jgi:hypothetical protein
MMDLFIWVMAILVVGFSYWCGRSDCQKNACVRAGKMYHKSELKPGQILNANDVILDDTKENKDER